MRIQHIITLPFYFAMAAVLWGHSARDIIAVFLVLMATDCVSYACGLWSNLEGGK